MTITRVDILVKPYAESKGFTPTVNKKGFWKEGVPNDPYSYRQSCAELNPSFSSVSVWSTRKGWCSAKLSIGDDKAPTGRYYDHEYFPTPEEAIDHAYGELKKVFVVAYTRRGVKDYNTYYLTDSEGETRFMTYREAHNAANEDNANSVESRQYTVVEGYNH